MSVQEPSPSYWRTMANFFGRRKDLGEPLLLLDGKPRLLILINVLGVLRRRLADEFMAVRAVQETSTLRERGIAYNTTLFRQGVSFFLSANRRLVFCQVETNVYRTGGKNFAGQPHPSTNQPHEGLMRPWHTNRHCQLSFTRHAVVPWECARRGVTRARTTSNQILLGRVTDRCLYSFSAS